MPVDGALNVPGLTAEVTNTRSRHTIGDDHPRPGISTAHATFSDVDHFSGSDDWSATPAPPGPRNCGHSDGPAARAGAASDTNVMRAIVSFFMRRDQYTRETSAFTVARPVTNGAAAVRPPSRL